MKSLALRIAEKYYEQNPAEQSPNPNWLDLERIFGNWLERLQTNPDHALATTNWAGKVTKAFFAAFDRKTPKRKPEMVALAKELLNSR